MKRLLLLIACFATLLSSYAYQTMTLLNGEELQVNIERIGEQEISYKKASNPNGPTYSIDRNKVFFILHDDGTREVITKPAEAGNSTVAASQTTNASSSSASATTIGQAAMNLYDPNEQAEKHKIFDHISFNPRVFLGYMASGAGINDTNYDLDWGGFGWRIDLNVLFPDSDGNSAWSVGLGIAGQSGMLKLQDGKNKAELGNLSAMYIGIPIYYWVAFSDNFMVGVSENFQFRVSQKLEGEKVEDMLTAFRFPLGLHAIGRVGGFELGLELSFSLGNTFKGDGISWSPGLGVGATIGYAF